MFVQPVGCLGVFGTPSIDFGQHGMLNMLLYFVVLIMNNWTLDNKTYDTDLMSCTCVYPWLDLIVCQYWSEDVNDVLGLIGCILCHSTL